MSKIDENYIAELKEYKKTAETRLKYSIERFDILIISLSSGGLVLGMNLFSNFKYPISLMSPGFFSIYLNYIKERIVKVFLHYL